MTYTDEELKKIEEIKDFYIRSYTDDEKRGLFKKLKQNDIRKLLKEYTNINRLQAKIFNNDDTLYEILVNKKYNNKFAKYLDRQDIVYLIFRFRMGNGRFKICSGYKPKFAFEMIGKLRAGQNYYDFSCGWGERLLVSMNLGVNYFGSDPNQGLCSNLNKLYNDYKLYTGNKGPGCDIRCQGSEAYVEEWENKMDLCFSSPPYFNYEIYDNNNEMQSTYNRDYNEWLEEYWRPTVQNCYKYLKVNGLMIVNITNQPYSDRDIEKDFRNIITSEGFEYVLSEPIYNTSHKSPAGNIIRKYEQFHIFVKKR